MKWLAPRRDIAIGAAFLLLLTQLTFFPYIWGDKALQESTVKAASLYNTGSRYPPAVGVAASRVLDAGAPAWQTEPQFALTHAIVFGYHAAPLWNPYSAFGTPLAADMLSQPYSPFAWVPITLSSARGYNLYVALRIFAAGFFFLLFLRLFVAVIPALVGSVAFMYTGCLWLYITMPELSVEVVTPAMLYAVELLLRKPVPSRAALFSLALGVSFLGGMPESSLLIVTFVYVYAVARSVTDASLRRNARAIICQLALGSLFGIGLAAILLVPFLEYVTRSWSTHPANVTVGLSGDPLSISWLVLYIVPLLNGPPWNDIFLHFNGGAGLRGFFGAAATFFALLETFSALGDLLRGRRLKTPPTLIFSSIALVLLLKRFAVPIVNWIGAIPNFNRVDFPKYEEIVVACCVAALTAFGVERVAQKRVDLVAAAMALLVPTAIIAAAVVTDYGQFRILTLHREYFELSLAGAITFLGVAVVLVGLARTRRISGRNLSCSALTLMVVEPLVVWIVPLYYVVNPQAPQSASALLGAPYVSDLQARLQDGNRFMAEDGVLFPEWSAVFAIPDVRELDGLLPERYLSFVRAFMPDTMHEELQTRFVGAGDIDFLDSRSRRFLTLSSVQYVGLNHPMADSGMLATAARAHPELQGPALHSGFFTISRVTRPGLFMHPSTIGAPRTELPLPIHVPRSATRLTFSIGMLPAVWSSTICGDGVSFVIDSHVGQTPITLFRRYIDPKHDAHLRRWLNFEIPISAYRGKTVDLALATEVGPSRSNCADWAVWSNMHFTPQREGHVAQSALQLRRTEPGMQLYEYDDPLPRVAIYRSVIHASDATNSLRLLTDPAVDVHRKAVVEGDDPNLADLTNTVADKVQAGRLEVYTPNFVRASVSVNAPSLVVLNDTFFPGWRASIDGVPARISITNYLFRGIVVGRGDHTVEFRYEPQSFRIGASVSLISLLEISGAIVIPAFRLKRDKLTAPIREDFGAHKELSKD